MRLDDLDPTEHADDLGRGGGGGGGFPLLAFLPLLFGRNMGCGGIVLIGLVVLAYFFLSGVPDTGTGSGGQQQTGATKACDTPEELFACRVMTSTEQVWTPIFANSGATYDPPRIRFYQGGTQSGCGAASSAVGPFYCPADKGVYIDTSFFDELKNKYGASGDAAIAYVIGHEVGHHIQHLDGTAERVNALQSRSSRTEGNALSVRMELQADCYAGVWAKTSGRLEAGDIEEAMRAANAIGDDTLQQQSQGHVVPDSFTHGTSAQRIEWLRRGLENGDPRACDTFAEAN